MAVSDTASYSGLSRWTCYQLVKQGKFRAKYHGRKVLISRESVDAYLASLPDERED